MEASKTMDGKVFTLATMRLLIPIRGFEITEYDSELHVGGAYGYCT